MRSHYLDELGGWLGCETWLQVWFWWRNLTCTMLMNIHPVKCVTPPLWCSWQLCRRQNRGVWVEKPNPVFKAIGYVQLGENTPILLVRGYFHHRIGIVLTRAPLRGGGGLFIPPLVFPPYIPNCLSHDHQIFNKLSWNHFTQVVKIMTPYLW